VKYRGQRLKKSISTQSSRAGGSRYEGGKYNGGEKKKRRAVGQPRKEKIKEPHQKGGGKERGRGGDVPSASTLFLFSKVKRRGGKSRKTKPRTSERKEKVNPGKTVDPEVGDTPLSGKTRMNPSSFREWGIHRKGMAREIDER